MEVIVLSFGGSFLVKAVHVKLANERVHVGVLEIYRKHFLSELGRALYYKPSTICDPVDDLPELLFLSLLKQVPKAYRRS